MRLFRVRGTGVCILKVSMLKLMSVSDWTDEELSKIINLDVGEHFVSVGELRVERTQ